jgi:hypothetical protein
MLSEDWHGHTETASSKRLAPEKDKLHFKVKKNMFSTSILNTKYSEISYGI